MVCVTDLSPDERSRMPARYQRGRTAGGVLSPSTLPRRRRARQGAFPRDAEALVETALQCVLSARQEVDLILAGDTEAVTAMRATLDAAMTALYRADRLGRVPGAPAEGTT